MKASRFVIACFVLGLVMVTAGCDSTGWTPHDSATTSTTTPATIATTAPTTPTTATTEATVGAWTPTTPGAMPPPDTSQSAPPTPPAPIDYTAAILSAVQGVVGDRAMSEKISYNPDSAYDQAPEGGYGVATVCFQAGNADLTTYAARKDIVDIAKAVVNAAPDTSIVNIDMYSDATDTYGNTKNEDAISVQLKRPTIDKINPDGFDPDNLPQVADFYKEMIKF